MNEWTFYFLDFNFFIYILWGEAITAQILAYQNKKTHEDRRSVFRFNVFFMVCRFNVVSSIIQNFCFEEFFSIFNEILCTFQANDSKDI